MNYSALSAVLFGASLLLAIPNAVRAQDSAARAQARENFTNGVSRYEGADYAGALEAFQEAYRLAPHPNVRVNMANCYEHLGRPLEALHHFERFLAEAEEPSAQQRREVREAVRRLEGQLATIRLAVAPDGATVTIDDTETRRAPVSEPLRLPSGAHRIVVRMDGYRTQTRDITADGGRQTRVEITLERGADQPAVAAAETTPDPTPVSTETAEPHASSETVPVTGGAETAPVTSGGGGFEFRLGTGSIITGTAMIAFTLGAVATGVVAMLANDDFERAVLTSNDPAATAAQRAEARQAGLDAAGLADTLSIVTDVLIAAAIASAGLTVFFVVVDGFEAGANSDADPATARLRWAPFATPNSGGFALSGAF